jgi:hypothetical protein
MKASETVWRIAAHISVHMLSPRDPTTSSGEQSLDGEPSWNAGSLQAPTIEHIIQRDPSRKMVEA